MYLYNKSQKWNWLAYVNNVYKDGYGNHSNGLDVIELSNGDRVEFYYVQGTVDKTNLTEVNGVALATVKTVVDIAGSPPSTPNWELALVVPVIRQSRRHSSNRALHAHLPVTR